MFLDILAEFFSTCSLLSDRTIHTNYLAPKIGSVALMAVGENPIFRSYTDGGAIYQTVFRLVLREPFDPSFNFSSFCSSFSDWIAESKLPSLPEGFSPHGLSIIKSGQIKTSSPSSSEFEIFCRFTYEK